MLYTKKLNGIQLGYKLEIKNVTKIDKQVFNYHIKTHQYGTKSEQVSHKKCDIKELFVYKVLNKLGILPEVHFFYYFVNKNVQFCIATMDILDYCRITFKNNNLNIVYSDGNIGDYIVEHKDFAYLLTFVDIITRIFLLSDILSNSSNYSFVLNDETLKLYAFDFQVKDTNYNENYSKSIFELFCMDNSYYSSYCQNILTDRDKNLRLLDAKRVIEYLEKEFLNILSICYHEIHTYFSSSDSLIEYRFENHFDLSISGDEISKNLEIYRPKYGDLNLYVMYLKKNFTSFSEDLKKHILESISTSSS